MADGQRRKTIDHVLVVGGCGFLGWHIVSLFQQRKLATKLSVLDLRTTNNRLDNVTYVDGDITDLDATRKALQQIRPDVVIHTASPHIHLPNELLFKVNVNGTKNLLQAAQKANVKAFVYTSSASVIYDERTQIINADERWPLCLGKDQPEYYTSTKGYAEMAVLEANRNPSTFVTCALRPAGIFGENDVQFIPQALRTLRHRQDRFQLGDNCNLFDVTYVGNVAWAHILASFALLHTHSILPTVPLDNERVDGEAFFITNDSPVYFWDFLRAVWAEAGHKSSLKDVWVFPKPFAMTLATVFEYVFWLLGKTPSLTRQRARYSCMTRFYCIDKAKQRLGYVPLWTIQQGVKRAVKSALEREKAEAQAEKKDQ